MNPTDHHLQQARTSLAMGHLYEAVRQLELAVSALAIDLQRVHDEARTAAHTASCLANGIQPD